jgi:hypothetical protein
MATRHLLHRLPVSLDADAVVLTLPGLDPNHPTMLGGPLADK